MYVHGIELKKKLRKQEMNEKRVKKTSKKCATTAEEIMRNGVKFKWKLYTQIYVYTHPNAPTHTHKHTSIYNIVLIGYTVILLSFEIFVNIHIIISYITIKSQTHCSFLNQKSNFKLCRSSSDWRHATTSLIIQN